MLPSSCTSSPTPSPSHVTGRAPKHRPGVFPLLGHRGSLSSNSSPSGLPQARRPPLQGLCELLFHFPSSPRSFPHASRPFHRGRELLAAGDDADKARATGASYRARQRAPHLTRNLTHTLASPPVPPNANPDLARTPAAAKARRRPLSGHSPAAPPPWLDADERPHPVVVLRAPNGAL